MVCMHPVQIALLYAAVAGTMPDYSMSPAAQQAAAANAVMAPAPAQRGSVAVPRTAPTAITRDTETLSSSQSTPDGSQSGSDVSASGGGGGSAAAPKPVLRSASGVESSAFSVPNPAGQAPQRPGLLPCRLGWYF